MTLEENLQQTRRLRMYAALSALAIVGAPDAARAQAKPVAVPVAVEAAAAKSGTISEKIILPGQVVAFRAAVLTAKVAGYVRSIPVDKGDRVRAGALIADLEAPELVADRAQYRAQVDVAKRQFDRMQQAVSTAPDLVSAQSVDEARGRLQIAQAQLERVDTLLRYARITAPFSGTITARYVDPGAFIPVATSSAQQSAAVVSLMDFSKVRVQVAVPERESVKIVKGSAATVTLKSLPNSNFKSAVTRVSYALDQNSKTMLAEIELANPGETLRPGMYASVQLAAKPVNTAVMAPVGAIVTEGGASFVYLAVNGKAAKTRVTLGVRDETNVELLTGVTPKQVVIIPGKVTLSDGAAISAAVKP